jgi:glucokinase
MPAWDGMQGMDVTGVVGHIGRKQLRFALTDGHGAVAPASMRHYGANQGSSVSGSLSAFQRDMGLVTLPPRLGLAVAGLARGDVISITQTRWFVSRSGLQAMLGGSPLILNDFEAEAWALSRSAGAFATIGSAPAVDVRRPGTFCVIGMTSGFGVAVLTREPSGKIHVQATEAGHAGFAPGSKPMADLVAAMFSDRFPVVAEHLISANGLVAIYNTIATMRQSPKWMTKPEDITRQIGSDPLAREACEMLCEAFWTYVGGLVLTFGAWDGIIVTGGVAHALCATLATPRMHEAFCGHGKYARQLSAVPRGLAAMEHGELHGAAEALHVG